MHAFRPASGDSSPLLPLPARAVRTGRRLALGCLIVLAGCGGGGDDPPPAPASVALPPLSADRPLNTSQVGTTRWPEGNTADGGQGEAIEGYECPAGVVRHEHAHLGLFHNGEAVAIPANVGILPATSTRAACAYGLHTHDASGTIHIEPPANVPTTLGVFFQIWGMPLESGNVAGISGLPVVAYINDEGDYRRHTGALDEIELISRREITIQIGSAPSEVPTYTWTGQ